MNETDLQIIGHLRRNARQSLASVARKLGMPISTIHDKLRSYSGNLIRKKTVLLNFEQLGFMNKVYFALKVPQEKRKDLQEFLLRDKNINSLCKVNHNFDFLVEGIFKNQLEAKDFLEHLQINFGVENLYFFDVLEELKKEEFLT